MPKLRPLFANPRIRCYTKLYVFRDPDRKVYTLLRRGAALSLPLFGFVDRYRGAKITEGSELLKEGRLLILQLLTGTATQPPFSSLHAHIGVGDGDDDLLPRHTGLTGVNKMYKLVDAGFPIIDENAVIFRATFAPEEANFEWNERTIANGPGDEYVNLDRMILRWGRKREDETWCIQVEYELGWRD
ncbi:MAG: hypothetical protein QXF87_09070 [Thermofilaceae archaeon]